MSTYNRVTLVGNLVKDPESKKVGKQSKTTFTIAVDRYMGKDKEAVADYFNVVSWGKLADVCSDYLQKGKKVLVDGRIQIRTYTQENEKKWVTEIVAENLKFMSALKNSTEKVSKESA